MMDFGISADKLAMLGAACVALLIAAPLAFAVRDELRRIKKNTSVVSLVLLSVCLAHFVVHGSLKTNGVGKLNAKIAEVAKVAEWEGCALSRPHGDEASSLVVSKAKQPTQAEFFSRAWNIRGAWEDSFWMDFADGFVFPWGTNRLSGVEVLSQGRVQSSHRDTNAIANVGVALSMVPGVSRFAYEHTPSNTYRFAWSDAVVGRVALNAPQYETTNASIELFRSGDSVITTNSVARRVKYVNPYDLDGDGLANWLDPHPSTSDGDCFGTGVDWLNLSCCGVLSATTNAHGGIVLTWKDGANPDAYYWLTFTSLADNNRITATCDGASNLGDIEIIAKEGQECRIPLLIGAKYLIESTDGIGDVSANDADAVVSVLEVGRKYEVILPLEISFERVGAAAQSQAARRRVAKVSASSSSSVAEWKLKVLPRDPGVKITAFLGGCCNMSLFEVMILWECEDECRCGNGEHPLDITFEWEGYTRKVEYLLTCGCAEPQKDDEPWIGAPQLWMSMPSVLYTNGDGTANPSDFATLALRFATEAPTNGTIRLEMTTINEDIAIWTNKDKTTRVNLPVEFDAETFYKTNFFVEGITTSAAKNANRIELLWFDDEHEQRLTAHTDYTVYCPVVDVVNNIYTADGGYMCNPAGIVAGTNATFYVKFDGLQPPAGDVKWSIESGDAKFIGGDTGNLVRVASDTPNRDVRLRVQVGDCVSRPIEFTAHVVEPISEKLSFWIVRDNKGNDASRTPSEISNIVQEVNRIYRQIGVSFYIDAINYLDNKYLLDLADDSARWGYDTERNKQLVDTAKNTGGQEIYFIKQLAKDGRIAHNNPGGIVASARADANTIAHELGHSFGCTDVYYHTTFEPNRALPDHPLTVEFAPDDWSNGDGCRYYEHSLTKEKLICRLLMCGFHSASRKDLSSGSIYGYSRGSGLGRLVDVGFFVNGVRRSIRHHE